MSWLDSMRELVYGFKNRNLVPAKRDDLQPVIAHDEFEPDNVFDIPADSVGWSGIVVHHSATKDNPVGNDTEAIRRFHTSYRVDGNIVTKEEYEKAASLGGRHCEKPWSDIGYHLLIERDGGTPTVKIGRSWNKAGAHAGLKGNNKYNETFLGLCVVGSFDDKAPDPETFSVCLSAIRQIMTHFGIQKENIIGHREVYDLAGVPRQKTCPGKLFDMDLLREQL